MTFYKVLVFIHIFSAIVGLGPGFILTFLVNRAKTIGEARHGFMLRNRIHPIVSTGGFLLLVTGLLMGIINRALWTEWWYIISLSLYLISLLAGPLFLIRFIKPIKKIIAQYDGDELPEQYYENAKILFISEHILNIVFLIIITLMITKPF